MLEYTDFKSSSVQVDSMILSPNWRALFLFSIYRLVISSFFIGSFVTGITLGFLAAKNTHAFFIVAWGYFIFAFICLFIIRQHWPKYHIQVFGQVICDIIIISIMIHLSSGLNTSLGMLLLVTVAGGGLLIEGRFAFFFAAIATLSILIHVSVTSLSYGFAGESYLHASMLGSSFFATALLAHILAKRARINELLAQQRGLHVRYLSYLNEQIVQHIQSGILVIDEEGRIYLSNFSANKLLSISENLLGQKIQHISPELAEQWQLWKKNPHYTLTPFQREHNELIASITPLKKVESSNYLIVLDDASLTTQRAHQLKLTSLGRLTASIAHEIRNPLSAITHAGQLLAESDQLSDMEHRLTQIIAAQSQRMNTIVENILQLSRREPALTQSLHLPEWLKTFKDEFAHHQQIAEQNIILTNDAKETHSVRFDPIQLYQVLTNLCENGLRYSQSEPLLSLKIGFNQETKLLYLDICDTGKGMDNTTAEHIFEPFFTTESQGTGLGLYVAKELCESNYARLSLQHHTKETGCCFRIYFLKTV